MRLDRAPVELRRYWGGRALSLEMADIADPRGGLVEFDFPQMPFEPRRSFVVHGVPQGVVRGGHAHKHGQQLLVCLAGTITVEMHHDGEIQLVVLSAPSRALLLTAGVWAQQAYSGPEAVLLVLASHPYDADSYSVEPP